MGKDGQAFTFSDVTVTGVAFLTASIFAIPSAPLSILTARTFDDLCRSIEWISRFQDSGFRM